MNHIKQTISGGKVIFKCEKCDAQQVATITSRESVDTNLRLFQKDHRHPGREK